MSSSGNVLKSNFIKFSGENTRVIDTSALVAKRMEGFTGVVREKIEPVDGFNQGLDGFISDPAIDMLTGTQDEGIADSLISDVQNVPVRDAEAEYQEIIDRANSEAEGIIAAARLEAESIKSNAYTEGLSQGQAKAQALLDDKTAELDAYALALNEEYEGYVKNIEPLMVEVISGVYKHIFSEGIYDNKSVFYSLINKALMHIENNGQITIYVPMQAVELVRSMKDDLIAGTSFKVAPEIMGKEDFKEGQIKIETPFGIVDCGLDTQLEELTDALRVLSYEENV